MKNMAKLVTNQSWDDFRHAKTKKSQIRSIARQTGVPSALPSPVDRGMQSNEYGMPEYIAWFMLSNFCIHAGMYSIQYHSISRKHGISVLSRSDYCIDCIRHVYRIWNSPQNISTRDGNESLRFQSKPEHHSEIRRCRRKRNAIGKKNYPLVMTNIAMERSTIFHR